jgi:hypothetical protein
MVVAAQHVVGYLADRDVLDQSVLSGQEEALSKLTTVLDEAAATPRLWGNLMSKMFSCQVSYGSNLTASLALKLNQRVPFTMLSFSAETAAAMQQMTEELSQAKQDLQQARQAEKPQPQVAPGHAASSKTGNNSSSSSGSSRRSDEDSSGDSYVITTSGSLGSSTGSSTSDAVAQLLKGGKDPQVLARRLLKQSKRLTAEAEEEEQLTTWNSFMVSRTPQSCAVPLSCPLLGRMPLPLWCCQNMRVSVPCNGPSDPMRWFKRPTTAAALPPHPLGTGTAQQSLMSHHPTCLCDR